MPPYGLVWWLRLSVFSRLSIAYLMAILPMHQQFIVIWFIAFLDIAFGSYHQLDCSFANPRDAKWHHGIFGFISESRLQMIYNMTETPLQWRISCCLSWCYRCIVWWKPYLQLTCVQQSRWVRPSVAFSKFTALTIPGVGLGRFGLYFSHWLLYHPCAGWRTIRPVNQ